MKNVLKILSLFFVISMVVMACGEDDPCEDVVCDTGELCQDGDCVNDPSVCGTCGTYNGNVDSGEDTAKFIVSGNLGLNRVLDPTPFNAVITQNQNNTDSLDVIATLDVEVSPGNTVDVPVEVTVYYNVTTNEFQAQRNREYTIKAAGLIDVNVKLVDFFGTLNSTDLSGEIIVDDPDTASVDNIDARFFFSGTK